MRVAVLFFEGSEKKVEVVVKSGTPSLRALGQDYWSELVACCGATILSHISNDQMDAYLLSESSLFVWPDRLLMITCGNITLVDSVIHFLDQQGQDCVDMITYQRKNEYQSHLQKTAFEEDVERLNLRLPGKAFRLGHLDGHHNYVWHMDKVYQPVADDITTELLMYHIEGEAADYLRGSDQTLEGIRQHLQLDALFPGFEFDEFLFEPFGYSMNAIRGDQYITMHITPQDGTSYVSFETDIDIPNECPELLNRFTDILNPSSFDLITFNADPKIALQPDVACVAHNQQQLKCGFKVEFQHFIKMAKSIEPALEI